MATLINGDGNAAVYAAQDSDWFAGVEGNTTKILKVGAKMEYEIEDANTIAIKNGVLVTKEGRRVQIDAGAIDEFIIPTGTQGVTRYFIIGYHLYTDASSNQLCETFVQLMANDTDTIPEDTFRGGSTDVYVSLYRVKQDGITLDTIQSLLPEGVDLDGIGDEIDDIKDDITQINSDLTELNDGVDVSSHVTPATGIQTPFAYKYGKRLHLFFGGYPNTFSNGALAVTLDSSLKLKSYHTGRYVLGGIAAYNNTTIPIMLNANAETGQIALVNSMASTMYSPAVEAWFDLE